MIDAKGLKAFIAIIEQQSFERAAQTLFITQSAVSQRLKILEQSLGQSLIIRTPQIKVTTAGQALLKYAQNLSQIERTLKEDLAPRKQRDWIKISIATNADSLSTWLPEALAPWCLKNKVLLDLKIDDQDQTHQLLKSGEVLGCISAVKQPAQGCTSTSLGCVQYHCIASPNFVSKYFANGVDKQSIQKAPTVIFNNKDQLQHQFLKEFFDLDANLQLRHFIPSSQGYLDWIRLGMGFGMAPIQQISPFLNVNKLVLLTPNSSIDVPLYWQQWGINTELGQSLAKQIIQFATAAHSITT
jgi:LysR family transcriptional regulator (chromosome initiation inhibitor)